MNRKPVVLCILDGWGLRGESEGNAVAQASTPNFDRLVAAGPMATLVTHGEAVGLPDGNIGNSEVGHLHIGAGRTVLSQMCRIDSAIASGEFALSPAIGKFAGMVKDAGGRAHIIGMISEVGVHSQLRHVVEAARVLDRLGVEAVVHALADGRDSAPGLAPSLMDRLATLLPPTVAIATLGGRYFAMDRDRRWDRIELACRTLLFGEGEKAGSAVEAAEESLARGVSDEFIRPVTIGGYSGMRPGDGVFIVNFRSDRVRQLAAALADPAFSGFNIIDRPRLATAMGMTDYFDPPRPWIPAVFGKNIVQETLGEAVARAGRSQFRLAETEKFPHVTYFLNGGSEAVFDGEERHVAQSPMVATYDLEPEMAAAEISQRLVRAIASRFDLIVVNFANPDMVGHTGDLGAAIGACEAVDRGLGLAMEATSRAGGSMIVTADHGNCELMIDPETGDPHTAHTTNPVPLLLHGGPAGQRLRSGSLSDLAPTVLDLMDLPIPSAMTGRSLLDLQG